MKYYHATTPEACRKILDEKVIQASWDGLVYLCRSPLDACKFVLLRGARRIAVLELNFGKKDRIEESFDHDETFFGCKAYVHEGDVDLTRQGHVVVTEYRFDLDAQANC